MANTLSSNVTARAAVLSRVRTALGKRGDRAVALNEAERYVASHGQGPRPALDADLIAHFLRRASDMASTVERLPHRSEIPAAVARYLQALVLPQALASHQTLAGVCWPELADLDWTRAGLAIEARPTLGHDRLAITGCFCAIAETGTLVMTSGADTPTASTLLPDTHVAVVAGARIVAGMEEAFALVRLSCRPEWKRYQQALLEPSCLPVR